MQAFINIPKRSGSCNISRNAALLDAVKSPTMPGCGRSWAIEYVGPASTIDALRHAKALRERLSMTIAELQENPHATFASLESAGLFGGFTVVERRGFWRVELAFDAN